MKTDSARLGDPSGGDPVGDQSAFLFGKLIPNGKRACSQSDFVEPAVPTLVVF